MNKKILQGMRYVLNKHDPIRIYFSKKVNFDEYDPEIKDIYKEFKKCKDIEDFTNKIHKIFQKWFSAEVAGNRKEYISLSKELFKLLKQYKQI